MVTAALSMIPVASLLGNQEVEGQEGAYLVVWHCQKSWVALRAHHCLESPRGVPSRWNPS